MELKNDLVLRAAKGEHVERTPVWIMRQAGRVLPEYRAVRAKLSGFIELVKTPERAAEVTIQPVDLLGVDAAIIFSDILVIPEAMGLPYEMVEKQGPRFPATIGSSSDLKKLHVATEDELGYVLDAIRLTKKELNGRVPLIGFAGAPFTIFCYMVEGSGSKTFSKAKKMMYQNPELAHLLLQMITDSSISYLNAQVEAGADMVQVFDSWAGILGQDQYREFSIPYLKQICEQVQGIPKTLFAKGAFYAVKDLAALDCDTIGLDWTMNPEEARALVGGNRTLQGNLDPCAIYADYHEIKRNTEKMLADFGPQRHIANLGHGLYPDLDPDKVRCFIDTVKGYRHAAR